jgi:hypothetical protein
MKPHNTESTLYYLAPFIYLLSDLNLDHKIVNAPDSGGSAFVGEVCMLHFPLSLALSRCWGLLDPIVADCLLRRMLLLL